MLLARRVAPKSKLIACYVDHGIRPKVSIARDVAAVRAQAAAAGATVVVRRVLLGPKTDGSPEERARVARYRALASAAQQSGATFVITGHHQNDLVETSLLALVRGSGIDGVAAMRPLRPLADGVTLVRPLLWATKAQCSDLLQRLRIPTSDDETNADTHIPRNAVRLLVSGLDRVLPGSSRGVARSAALLSDDKALLNRMTAAAYQRARLRDSNDVSAAVLRRMPIALVRRVIRYALAQRGLSLRDFSFGHCNAIAAAIKEKRGGIFHAGTASVVLSAGKLTVQTAGSARMDVAPVSIVLDGLPCKVNTPLGCASLGIGRARARKTGPLQRLDLAVLQAAGSLEIRQPRQGDACIPSGRSRPISLARFLGKSGIPRSGRQAVSLLCAGGRIAAVLGLRVMEPFKPKGQGLVLEVGWRATDI
ncbi:MAG: tRNA lysidine(34) synthetase TilS [Candidatus Eremiobacteraeota bacterium]|nr:tRNA lysidine(34) synthetase TilS [Candidatus Eremiobacteraeota bacterium]